MKEHLRLVKEFRLYAPWERPFEKILSPIEEFIKTQTASALALLLMTLVALFLANSPWQETYHHLFEEHFSIGLGPWKLDMSLHHWINDGLMTFFFFLIGLEIKRELLVGELSELKAALLPVIAAIGGMAFPALIYFFINRGSPTVIGWGIPMATDIAFAISILVLLRRYVPAALVTFLIALAIVDDLGAVLVIALFYTDTINFHALGGAFLVWLALWLFNLIGVYRTLPYFLGGLLMWGLMLASGVHATIAGVLTALTIPTRPRLIPKHFRLLMESFVEKAKKRPLPDNIIPDERQKEILHLIHTLVTDVQPPSYRIEHALHLPVALIVIPLFALANAGVHLDLNALLSLGKHPVSLGILTGLIVGKTLGIAGTAFLTNKIGLTSLPSGTKGSQLVGIGLLAGIGFTMCIFIAELAWPGQELLLQQAKMAILLASFLAGLLGYLWLRFIA